MIRLEIPRYPCGARMPCVISATVIYDGREIGETFYAEIPIEKDRCAFDRVELSVELASHNATVATARPLRLERERAEMRLACVSSLHAAGMHEAAKLLSETVKP